MTANVIMPQLGETVAEGKILAWFKNEGDEVNDGDNLFEIETDKVTMEVQSTVAGALSEIRVKAGEVAKVGAVVAVIGGKAEARVPSTEEVLAQAQSARSPYEEVLTPTDAFGVARGPLGLRVTPLARRLIVQNCLDIEAIAREVTAAGGTKIAEKDVRGALKRQSGPQVQLPPDDPVAVSPEVLSPDPIAIEPATRGLFTLNTIRRKTGERLAENWRTIPHVFQAIEVDFTKVEAVRAEQKERFKAEHGLSLTYLPFIARATCLTLREFPQINSRLDGPTLVLSGEINLGIAIDLSHNGLVVPVIRNAHDLTLSGLSRAIGRQVEKARSGKLTREDFLGGTYSISNNGAFGTTFTAPIINAPQVAILSTDAIRLKPAVVETAEGIFIAPRLIGMVGQSFDHRAFDGAYSAAFLSRLKKTIELREWSSEFA